MVGRNSSEAWEEGVHCCRLAHKDVAKKKIPKVFGTSTEELAIDRPSFCLAMVPFPFFSIFFIFLFGCMTSKCYLCLMYHVLCVCSHGVRVWMCVCEAPFYPCAGDVMHGVHERLSVCVHTCTYFLVSVLFSLRC